MSVLRNALIARYAATSRTMRRVVLALLVPAAEYAGLEPARHALNSIARFSHVLGLAMLPLLLGVMVLMAAVIVLFVLEFFKLISHFQTRWIATVSVLGIYAWVILPLFLMRLISD